MTIQTRVSNELTKFNLSSTRIPFTFHHDFIRANSEVVDDLGLGRSQVAKFPVDDDQLWACCFLQAIAELTDEQKICSGIDPGLFKECLVIAREHIKSIEHGLTSGVWR